MLTHGNFLAATRMYRDQLLLDDLQPVMFMFLPLAHVLARVAQAVTLDVGGTIAYWSGDPKLIVDDVAAIAPTHLPAVPRIYEKIHTAVVDGIEAQVPLGRRRGPLRWALAQGARARVAERAGESRPVRDRPVPAGRPAGAEQGPAGVRPRSRWRWSARRRSPPSCSSSSTRAECSCSRATA